MRLFLCGASWGKTPTPNACRFLLVHDFVVLPANTSSSKKESKVQITWSPLYRLCAKLLFTFLSVTGFLVIPGWSQSRNISNLILWNHTFQRFFLFFRGLQSIDSLIKPYKAWYIHLKKSTTSGMESHANSGWILPYMRQVRQRRWPVWGSKIVTSHGRRSWLTGWW